MYSPGVSSSAWCRNSVGRYWMVLTRLGAAGAVAVALALAAADDLVDGPVLLGAAAGAPATCTPCCGV